RRGPGRHRRMIIPRAVRWPDPAGRRKDSPRSLLRETGAPVWNSEIWSNAAAMKKERRGPGGERRWRAKAAPAATMSVGTRIGITALSLAIFSTALVVDMGADSAFDAPKRLFCVVLTAVAAGSWVLGPPRWLLSRQSPLLARLSLWLPPPALLLAGLSAFLSPRQTLSLDALRVLFLFALLLPIGASRIVEKGRIILLSTFVAVSAVNAIVSILQARGIYQPFTFLTESVREST